MELIFQSENIIDIATSQNVVDDVNGVSSNSVDSVSVRHTNWSHKDNAAVCYLSLVGSFTDEDKSLIIDIVEGNYGFIFNGYRGMEEKIKLTENGAIYWGDENTDGNVRMRWTGTSFVTEQRQSGVWTPFETNTP